MIVLMPNCGFLSETSRQLAIAQALRERGQPVLLASQGGPYAHLLADAGFDWTPLPPGFDADRTAAFIDAICSMGVTDRPLYGPDELRTAVLAQADLLRSVGATAVVTGFELPAYLASSLVGVPLVTDHGGVFVPPVLAAGLAPVPVNPGRADLARLPRWAQRRLVNLVPRLLTRTVAPFNALADQLGVARLPTLMSLMCGDLTLVTELPEVLGLSRARLESWTPRWPSRVRPGTTFRFTGPLFARLDRPVPERVDRFLTAHDRVVYLSPTSVHAPMLRRLVRSLQETGEAVLVSATVHDIDDLADDRTMVADLLPNHEVMPRVAACVVMGGQGSVQSSLAAGTPLVGLPYHPEQELNVAVAERHGAALRLSPATAGTPELTTAVRRVLDEPSFAAGARWVSQRYDGVDGAGLAADAILDYLAERSARATGAVRG